MRILDICCGVGGAAVGYARAGWDVTGVDSEPQPEFPFEFILADGLGILRDRGFVRGFDAVHMSWPCQAYTTLQKGSNRHRGFVYPKLTEPGRELAETTGMPYVIENPAARPDVVLCGEMFGLGVIRHRQCELGGWTTEQPVHLPHRGRVRGWSHGAWREGPYFAVYGEGGGKGSVEEWREAMGIDWTWNRKSIAEAIPPAYTEWLGTRLLEHLTGRKAGVQSVT